MSNVSREKSFNFGCVIRFTLQCSSSRLSETSGQYESEITIALLRRNTAISSSGFGSARTKTTQLHQAVAVAAELFGQRLAGATDCGGGPLSFAATLAALPSISEIPFLDS